MRTENRIKIKSYNFEKAALIDFIEHCSEDISPHVKNAVSQRIRVISREIEILTEEN